MTSIPQSPESAISSAFGSRHPICTVWGQTTVTDSNSVVATVSAIERLLLLQKQGTIAHLPFHPRRYDRLIVRQSPIGYSVQLIDPEGEASDLILEGDDLWGCVDDFLFQYYGSGQVVAA